MLAVCWPILGPVCFDLLRKRQVDLHISFWGCTCQTHPEREVRVLGLRLLSFYTSYTFIIEY